MRSLFRLIGRFVGRRLLPRIAYPVLQGPLRGAKFILGAMSGEGGGSRVYFNLIEPDQTAAFITTLKEGQVLFDIGANVGYYTVLGSRLVGIKGKVIAFEPVVRNLFYLYQHILLNKVNNVTILPAACSDTVSLAIFSSEKTFAMGRLVDKNDNNSTFPVPVISVDEVIRQLGISPDVMKIDVEGAELSVLKGAHGALYKAKPKIFLSTHSDILKKTCLEYLREYGYTYKLLFQDKLTSEFLAYYVAQ